jgi:hypothetical protein
LLRIANPVLDLTEAGALLAKMFTREQQPHLAFATAVVPLFVSGTNSGALETPDRSEIPTTSSLDDRDELDVGTPCKADTNKDGFVNVQDLMEVLAAYGFDGCGALLDCRWYPAEPLSKV